jgi:hypothetical protein
MALYNLQSSGDCVESEIEAALFFNTDVVEESIPLENGEWHLMRKTS